MNDTISRPRAGRPAIAARMPGHGKLAPWLLGRADVLREDRARQLLAGTMNRF